MGMPNFELCVTVGLAEALGDIGEVGGAVHDDSSGLTFKITGDTA